MKSLVCIAMTAFVLTGSARAVDLVRGRTELPELVLGNGEGDDFVVSQKDITMESGKSYRLAITAKGSKEYKLFAPEFFRHIWFNQIVINHLEVHMQGAPHHLEFDDQGTINVEFVTIRPGEYPWYVQGLEERGMRGRFIVK